MLHKRTRPREHPELELRGGVRMLGARQRRGEGAHARRVVATLWCKYVGRCLSKNESPSTVRRARPLRRPCELDEGQTATDCAHPYACLKQRSNCRECGFVVRTA